MSSGVELQPVNGLAAMVWRSRLPFRLGGCHPDRPVAGPEMRLRYLAKPRDGLAELPRKVRCPNRGRQPQGGRSATPSSPFGGD